MSDLKIYNSQGRFIQLGREQGRGGEGIVYNLCEYQGFVAKIYHNTINKEKAEKISTMVHLQNDRLLQLSTWPTDTLHSRPNGPTIGFFMPKIDGFKDIHLLYGIKSRLSEFSGVSWPFLLHTATNLARAFAVIHKLGHVIGDVNHSNIVVSNQAIVKLIDCDSFQISNNGRHYFCDVGVSTHQPPELQAISLRNKIRTENHDNFGLAILIFQLLFLGRHPFSGTSLLSGDMPIERAIKEFRFAYGSSAYLRKMKQPPGTLPLEAVPEQVGLLFERAFSPDGIKIKGRPTAQEWIIALENLSTQLNQCNLNSGHNFFNRLKFCPWCEIESKTGIELFDVSIHIKQNMVLFNLNMIWNQITSIPSPGPAPSLPEASSLIILPTQDAIKLGKARRLRSKISFGIFSTVFLLVILLPIDGIAAIGTALISAVFATILSKTGPENERQKIEKQYNEALNQWNHIKKRWKENAGEDLFLNEKKLLEKIKGEYENLQSLKQLKNKQPNKAKEKHQLKKFLEKYIILNAKVTGIGPGRKATLQSYGIETAADVTYNVVINVPGFGPSYTKNLVDWRKSIEKSFVFNPKIELDPADIAIVEKEFEKKLLSGAHKLKQITQNISHERQKINVEIEESLKKLAQLQADFRAF